VLTSKVALEATSREPCAPGATKTRLKLSLKTGLWKVSVCTTMPPVMSTTGFISASPTCRHMPVSKQVTMYLACLQLLPKEEGCAALHQGH